MGVAMPKTYLTLSVLPQVFAVCRLQPQASIPAWATRGAVFSITRSSDEMSIVCPEKDVPAEMLCARGWRAMRLEGPLDFSLVGILVAVTAPLAEAGISIFAISTYNTDYILVREGEFVRAVAVLSAAGHTVSA